MIARGRPQLLRAFQAQGPTLITGGCGYVGSHVAVELLRNRHPVVLLDSLANSRVETVASISRIAGVQVPFARVDLLDPEGLAEVFSAHRFQTVVHCAGLKSVSDSVSQPLRYYRENVQGALNLLQAMARTSVRRIVFSSSATVYGLPDRMPIDESFALKPVNPYGWSKRMVERILEDHCATDAQMQVVALRYFNPAGSHPAGLLGENPADKPTNLFPLLGGVASGLRPSLTIFGTDYSTPDGTCVRDYVHVMDVARAHRMAIEAMPEGFVAANLGTGAGCSVLEVIAAYRRASALSLPCDAAPRRAGDVEALVADPSLAERLWGWKAHAGLDDMCRDAWRSVCHREHQSETPKYSSSIVQLAGGAARAGRATEEARP